MSSCSSVCVSVRLSVRRSFVCPSVRQHLVYTFLFSPYLLNGLSYSFHICFEYALGQYLLNIYEYVKVKGQGHIIFPNKLHFVFIEFFLVSPYLLSGLSYSCHICFEYPLGQYLHNICEYIMVKGQGHINFSNKVNVVFIKFFGSAHIFSMIYQICVRSIHL